MTWYVSILSALVATFGFAVLYNVEWKRLPVATLGGGIAWAVYMLVEQFTAEVFVMALAAGFVATFYSEIAAYFCRTPSTVFLIPCVIPLVPGSGLYYGMSSLIGKDYSAALDYFGKTAYIMLGVAGGIVAASLIVGGYKAIRSKRK